LTVTWAVVAGPSRVGTAVRRSLAPALNAQPVAVGGGAVAVLLLFVAWSPAPNPQSGLRMVALAVLFGLGVVSLRRRTLAEFPDLRLADLTDGLKQRLQRMTNRFRPQPATAGNGTPPVDLTGVTPPSDELLKA